MLHVPFKGLSPMLTELLADRIDMSIAPLPGLIGQQIESGTIRALGLARAERVPQLAAVPTFAESGVPGVEADAWSALFAPARTPAPIIERLYLAIATALSKDLTACTPSGYWGARPVTGLSKWNGATTNLG